MFRIVLLLCVPLLATASAPPNGDFETAHKLPSRFEQNDFHTAHKIPVELPNPMALLPSKEKPELNPILSALINEDVMKSIEAKRAIEERELAIVKAEAVLTTPSPIEQRPYDDDINVDFVDQMINLDVAGSENNKKSRIEIKKGPNGQEYEYEYVYYYEDEDEGKQAKKANKAAEPAAVEKETRGKSRYSSIDRSTTPTENTLVNVKGDETGSERLPAATRFPNRGKSAEVPPTPPLDSLENAAQKKKSSIKRPSLELVDSETFNTDEKQIKGTRNGDTEKDNEKDNVEQNALVATKELAKAADEGDSESIATEKDEENVEQTTPAMEKAALDLYAILANENFNMDMITNTDMDITTTLPDTTNIDEDNEGATTVSDSENDESSATLVTSTTTTTTTPAPTTTTEATTTTTTEAPALIGGARRGLKSPPGRNRFKGKQGGAQTTSTTSTTESPEKPALAGKLNKNRFSRPPIGGRNRAKPSPSSTTPQPIEEEVQVKTVESTNSGFSRNRPRNRFNLRGTSTTEKVSNAEEEETAGEEKAATSTARPTRGRPGFGARGRSRTTAAPKNAETEEHPAEEESAAEGNNLSQSPSTAKPRFSLKTNRLNLRGKSSRTTTSAPPTEAKEGDEETKADDNTVKESDETPAPAPSAGRFQKGHHRVNNIQKTDTKSKIASAPAPVRKVNPLLAKRRLQLGSSTTESSSVEQEEPAEKSSPSPDSEDATSEDIGVTNAAQTDEVETTTKQTPRGLGLLGQRRRLPLRKPGTLL